MIGSQNSTGLTRSPRCFATLTARIHPTRQALRQIRRRGLISDDCSGQLTRCSRASSVFDCTFWTQTCTADQSGRDGCDDGDGQRLLLSPAHAYMPQAKGVLPDDIPIRGARAQHCATVWPGNKVCRVCGSHLAVRVNGLNAASTLTCAGLLGKRRVRTLVRTGFAGLHPGARENGQGRKLNAGAGLQPIRWLGCRNRPTSLCTPSDASDTGCRNFP